MSLTKDETIKSFKIMASLLDKGMFLWNELKGLSDVMEKLNEKLGSAYYRPQEISAPVTLADLQDMGIETIK